MALKSRATAAAGTSTAPLRAGRVLSLPKAVARVGSIEQWNEEAPEVYALLEVLQNVCTASTVEGALREVDALKALGSNLACYAYMRMLYNRSLDLYYATLLARPQDLLPLVYTPTVGEACQKFGTLPVYRRGCYLSITDRGNFRSVLEEYAAAELTRGPGGQYLCDCIVFSDGGRILGLGDLGAWGMGIPIGKLDLYTVCAGVNPHRTMPVILDAGCTGKEGNTDKLVVRDHRRYTGLKQERVMETSEAGTQVNAAYYGPGNLIEEFMEAASDLFGRHCLLQFEDFNSNDAFPLLANYRDRFLTYNDDIQGTAGVTVAGLMGAIKLRSPDATQLIEGLRGETFFFHGAGSANLGAAALLVNEAGVPRENIIITNSRGVIWKSADGREGSFRNDEQKEWAMVGKPSFDGADLGAAIKATRPTCLIGAVGRDPGCFSREVIEAMGAASERPVVFALSNPKTQAEISAADAYAWSGGRAIYGSGTAFDPVVVGGRERSSGQVNNVYIFPGMSFGAVSCKCRTIPERLFMVAAEAVALTLDAADVAADRVVPHLERIRDCGLNVATAVVVEAQRLGLADECLGASEAEVKAVLRERMWAPSQRSAL